MYASVISVGPTFSSVAFFLVFPGLLSSVCVCVCVCVFRSLEVKMIVNVGEDYMTTPN